MSRSRVQLLSRLAPSEPDGWHATAGAIQLIWEIEGPEPGEREDAEGGRAGEAAPGARAAVG